MFSLPLFTCYEITSLWSQAKRLLEIDEFEYKIHLKYLITVKLSLIINNGKRYS